MANSTDSELNRSGLSDMLESQSLLPQGGNQCPMDRSNRTESISDDSTIEISGFTNTDCSGTDYNSEVTDPFNSIFYHVIPSKESTNIMFYTKPLFNSIVSVLGKEFQFPEDSSKKFSLRTHVDGKRCHIHIDRTDLTISANGPGHVYWKDNNFRKLSVNMFKNFVDDTNSVLKTKTDSELINISEVSHKKDIAAPVQEGASIPKMLERLETTMPPDSPLMRNISTLMDMIHTLQGQVSKLTSEVNKLVQQGSQSLYQTVDETHINQTVGNLSSHSNSKMIQSQDNQDTCSTQNSPIVIEEHESRSNATQRHSEGNDFNTVRLTSTPRVNTHRQQQKKGNSKQLPQNEAPKTQPSSQEYAIEKKILLIGDSIVSSINQSGLKKSVYKHGIPGATVDSILKELQVYDLQNFSHIIIYVGGNNASQGTDVEYFEEKYEQLLRYIKQKSQSKVILSNSCPRGDVDTSEINSAIKSLSEYHRVELVDMQHAFQNNYGDIIDRYYARDSIHLSESGVKRFLGTINSKLEIVKDFAFCTFTRFHGRRRNSTTSRMKGRQSRHDSHQRGSNSQSCNKCGERNHQTKDCKHAEQLKCHQCGFFGHKSKLNRCSSQ